MNLEKTRLMCAAATGIVLATSGLAAALAAGATRPGALRSSVGLPEFGSLVSVAATSATNAWAVGYLSTRNGTRSLVLHWNGRRWSRVASPDPAPVVMLTGVTATSARSAWAVGRANHPLSSSFQSLILRWNGKTWTQVTTSAPGVLLGLAATSATNAWAVGFTQPSHNVLKVLLMHWNGTAWKTLT